MDTQPLLILKVYHTLCANPTARAVKDYRGGRLGIQHHLQQQGTSLSHLDLRDALNTFIEFMNVQ